MAGYPRQDAERGRDRAKNNDRNGHAGFSFTKLDADGEALPASATDWTCVRDNVTRLVWEVKTDDGGPRDWEHTYTWSEAKQYAKAVKAAGLCGSRHWRLPTVKELVGIVDYSVAWPGPTIDTAYFPNTLGGFVWSGSPYANLSNYAWGVYFGLGYADYYGRGGGLHVRLVRGGQ